MWPDNRALLSYGRKRTLQINKLIVQLLLIVHQLHQSFYFFTTLRHYHMTWRPHTLSYKRNRTLSFGAWINSSALTSTCVSVCIHTYNITIRDAMNDIFNCMAGRELSPTELECVSVHVHFCDISVRVHKCDVTVWMRTDTENDVFNLIVWLVAPTELGYSILISSEIKNSICKN